MLTDAHLHLVDFTESVPTFPEEATGLAWSGCAASHGAAEFASSELLRARLAAAGLPCLACLGIHPQGLTWEHASLLEGAAASGAIDAIGEAGFDFFGDSPRLVRDTTNERAQREAFEFQLALAERFGLPLVLHLRRAMDLAFEYAPRLKRLPAAVFHSYSGNAVEAQSLVKRGVNAYFSFGAVLLNGHKRAIEACAKAPADRLLSETDAPWQPPRAAPWRALGDIALVVRAMADLRGQDPRALERELSANFARAYGAT